MPCMEDKVRNFVGTFQRTRVICDVVVCSEDQQHYVGRVGEYIALDCDEFLRSAVAGHTEVEHLDTATCHCRTTLQSLFHYRPKGLLERHLQSLCIGIANNRDA